MWVSVMLLAGCLAPTVWLISEWSVKRVKLGEALRAVAARIQGVVFDIAASLFGLVLLSFAISLRVLRRKWDALRG